MYHYELYIFLFSIVIENNAYAYLDPGSGGSILQMIIAFLAAVGATLSFYWSKLKLFLVKLFKKKKDDKSN